MKVDMDAEESDKDVDAATGGTEAEDPVSIVERFLVGAVGDGDSSIKPSQEVVSEAVRALRNDRELTLEFISAIGLGAALEEGTFPEKTYEISRKLRM